MTRHHLDSKAAQLADAGGKKGKPGDLLTQNEVAAWLGVKVGWLVIGRTYKYGPPVTNPYPRVNRYRRADVVRWLRERARAFEKAKAKVPEPA